MYLGKFVSGERCYTEASKWLLKLLLGFYKKYNMMEIIYRSDKYARKRCIDIGGNIFNVHWVDSITILLEPAILLHDYNTDENKPHICHTRLQLWRFFLIEHYNDIPQEYKDKGLTTINLLGKIWTCGTRNDKELKKLFKIYFKFEHE